MIILVMGVSGSGKTTIGQLLAASLHWEFQDADSFHSPENIAKMQHNIPLTDADRMPWLQNLQTAIAQWLQENKNVVMACSALKASYRQFLLLDGDRIKLVYLNGSFELIQQRLQTRQNHFMTEKLLNSQFDALEEPDNALYVDVSQTPEKIVDFLKTRFE
ncbi:gluconokinase [Halotia branconii]|uniref:Gluconokinase n=1 Tax=Halotia branconii CENA392 TaxID=1539056 RepID=A0AAJ6NSI1_9CYAN|nr:gluconokinase [Halotia branconii]WGV25689.1 gluconokinase [Halotia branconii CENA392]